MRIVFLSLLAPLVSLAASAAPIHVVPPDAGVVDITAHGAIPDDGKDDTEALRAAIKEALDREGRYSTPALHLFATGGL